MESMRNDEDLPASGRIAGDIPVNPRQRIRSILFWIFGVFLLLYNLGFSGGRSAQTAPEPAQQLGFMVAGMLLPLSIAIVVICIGMIRKRYRNRRWVAKGLFWSMLVVFITNLATVLREATTRIAVAP